MTETDTAQEKRRFDVIFEGVARSSGKMRCDMDVELVTMKERFVLAADEGKAHGGDNTAPPPLAHFSIGLAACLMTQIRAFAKRLRIPVRGVEISARLEWEAEQVGREPYVGAPVAFSLDVDLDTDASAEDQHRLLEAAQKGCFVEQTLAQPNEVKHRLKVGDQWQVA